MSDTLPFGKPKVRKQSTITKEKRQAYKRLRWMYLREHRWCEPAACQEPGDEYPNRATAVHHTQGRTGDLMLDTSTWLACCEECHRLIHDNPEWARKQGYMESRHGEVTRPEDFEYTTDFAEWEYDDGDST